jgi:hypothetical protein
MTRLTYNLHRVFAGIFLIVFLFCAADYYLDLGFFGSRVSMGILIFAILVAAVYGSFFSPTPEDVRQHRDAKTTMKNQ